MTDPTWPGWWASRAGYGRPQPSPTWGPAVEITPQQIYDAVLRVEGQVGPLVSRVTEHDKDMDDHEKRLRSLEAGRWPMPAAALLLSAVSVLATILPRLMGG